MGYPLLTKTITVAWDGVDWRDQVTGVLITGIPKLYSIPVDEPSQPSTHPFDKSFFVTYEQAQKMIADAFNVRGYDDHMVGFSSEINALERRIAQLERPWWKRWHR